MLRAAATAFGTVFLAELPDKTMVATLVLTARYRRPLAVWLGVASAFCVHVVVAVTAGSLLSALPDRAVSAGAAVLFLVGAIVLWRDRSGVEDEEVDGRSSAVGAFRTSLAAASVVLIAEWGDLTQLATASLAAKLDEPIGVGLGALAALWAVAAIAATAGRTITKRLPVMTVRKAAAVVFSVLGVLALVDAIRG